MTSTSTTGISTTKDFLKDLKGFDPLIENSETILNVSAQIDSYLEISGMGSSHKNKLREHQTNCKEALAQRK